MIAQLLRDFASLFVVSDPLARAPRDVAVAPAAVGYADPRTLWALAFIVAAGALLRFWGLGAVGLHGDEKTMALPVMSLVEHGLPLMPSGMFYPRAVGQLYLMATSVLVFGQSEWALRFPSAACGVVLIVLTWKVGQRFLTPRWNLALTAAVAFLPSFIEDAQTARMYVFLVTCVAGYMVFLFEWERSGRIGYLVAAVVTMVVGIQFHTLAIFAAFLVLLPGLLQADARKFWVGVVAFAVMAVGFKVINTLIDHAYPQSVEADSGPVGNGPHAAFVPHLAHLWLVVAAVPALLFALWVARGRPAVSGAPAASVVAVVSIAGALVAEVALAWHLAVLFAVAGLVVAGRVGAFGRGRIALFLAVSAAIAVAEVVFLVQHAAGSPKQIAGVMLGWPSVWPFIAIADYSAVVMLAAVGSLACALWLLAQRRAVPDHVLMLVLGVWVPLLMIGLIKWNIPARYAAAQIMPLLLCAFAAMQWAAGWATRRGWLGAAASNGAVPAGAWASWAAVVACVLVVNPVEVVGSVGAGYANHPDHKGAAEFVESLHPGPRDIIVAEDVLQQTYYLGHVDYWLVNKQVAAPFMHRVNGRWLDFYTDTPLIGTGVELKELVERPNRGAIYVIGSGENQEDGRTLMRAFGISEALQSPPFQLVYRGRDGLTRVWKVAPPSPTVAKGQ
jgi:hypothetical protein